MPEWRSLPGIMENFRTSTAAAHTTRDDIAVDILLADHHGAAPLDAAGRQVVTVIDAPAFDIAALMAITIRPDADARAIGADAELHLSE